MPLKSNLPQVSFTESHSTMQQPLLQWNNTIKLFSLFVKTLMGNSFLIRISNDKTIAHLKHIIHEQESIPLEAILLVFCDCALQNDFYTISEYGIQNGSTLQLLVKMSAGPGSQQKIPRSQQQCDDSIIVLLCKQNQELLMLELHMKNVEQRKAAASKFLKLTALQPTLSSCQLISEISGLTMEELMVYNRSFDFDEQSIYPSRPTSSSSTMSTGTFLSLMRASSVSSFGSRPESRMGMYEEDDDDLKLYYRSSPMSAKSASRKSSSTKNILVRPATAICLMRTPDINDIPYYALPNSRPASSSTLSKTNTDISSRDLNNLMNNCDLSESSALHSFQNMDSKVSFDLDEYDDELMIFQSNEQKRNREVKTKSSAAKTYAPQLQAAKVRKVKSRPRTPAILKPTNLQAKSKSAMLEKESELKQFNSAYTINPIGTTKPKTPSRIPEPVAKKTCFSCSKKLGLTSGFKCRCGMSFCTFHRHSDRHKCSFDYKEAGRIAMIKDNPLIRKEKLLKL